MLDRKFAKILNLLRVLVFSMNLHIFSLVLSLKEVYSMIANYLLSILLSLFFIEHLDRISVVVSDRLLG